MSQFSVAHAQTNHHGGKNGGFASNEMAMVNLLAHTTGAQSSGSMIMPTMTSFRSSSHRRRLTLREATCTNPHSHRPNTTNFSVRISGFDSHDSTTSSSALVGGESLRICGHQPMTVSSNQRPQIPNAADSLVTLDQDSHFFNKPSNGINHHPNSQQNSRINHNHKKTNTMTAMRQSSSTSPSDQECFIEMKRQGSHDYFGSGSNHAMSVTSALRSRAIAIHPSKTPHPADLEEQDAQESLKVYDQATWRMYNRIVDHRRNQASSRQPTTVVSDNVATLQSLQALNNLDDFHHRHHPNNILIDGDDADHGEIFQLDL